MSNVRATATVIERQGSVTASKDSLERDADAATAQTRVAETAFVSWNPILPGSMAKANSSLLKSHTGTAT